MITAQTILEVVAAEPAADFVKRILPHGWDRAPLFDRHRGGTPPEVWKEREAVAIAAVAGIPQGVVYHIDYTHPQAEAVVAALTAVHDEMTPAATCRDAGSFAWTVHFCRLAAEWGEYGFRLDNPRTADFEAAYYGIEEVVAVKWLWESYDISARISALAGEQKKVAEESADPYRRMDDFSRSALRRVVAREGAAYAAALHRRMHAHMVEDA